MNSLEDTSDQQRFLEVLSYILFSSNPTIIVFLHGEGGSGKSTFVEAVTSTLLSGPQACATTTFSDLANTFETHTLLGASVLLLPDVEYVAKMSREASKSWGILRRITGCLLYTSDAADE